MDITTQWKPFFIKYLHLLVRDKDKGRPVLRLLELSLLVAVMVALMYYDPFRVCARITDHIRFNFPLCTKEPRLLYYLSVYLGSFIFKIITLAFIAILIAWDRIGPREELALKRPSSSAWMKYIFPFFILSAFLRTCYSSNPLVTNLPIRLVTPGAMAIGNMAILLSVVMAAPIIEELIFRGYMYDVLRRGFGSYIAVAVTSLLFALAHMPQMGCEVSGFFIIFFMGSLFGIARYSTGSIYPAMAFHAIYNFTYVAVGAINFLILGY